MSRCAQRAVEIWKSSCARNACRRGFQREAACAQQTRSTVGYSGAFVAPHTRPANQETHSGVAEHVSFFVTAVMGGREECASHTIAKLRTRGVRIMSTNLRIRTLISALAPLLALPSAAYAATVANPICPTNT